jgi:uncharacterized protein YlxP (DUF503 family)
LKKLRRSVCQQRLRTWAAPIISKQGYEDAIENMKIQFAAISEEKAEVERELEPLAAESAELKRQEDMFESRREQHGVSLSYDALYDWSTNRAIATDRASGNGALESHQRLPTLSEETYRGRGGN